MVKEQKNDSRKKLVRKQFNRCGARAVVNEITEMNNAYNHARAREVADVSARAGRYSDRSCGSARDGGFSGSDGGFGGGDFSSGGDF